MTDSDPEHELAASLEGLEQLLALDQPLPQTLLQVAGLAVAAIPGADGAGLTLLELNRADTMVANADFVRTVDALQYGLGEGPCLLAVKEQAVQVCGSLGGDERWPRFGPRAGRLGVHSALSLPLLIEDRILGALNVYGHARDAFDAAAVDLGVRFSRPAALTAANALLLEESRRAVDYLEHALVSRAVVDQAIGILRSRSGVNPEEAFEQLRAMSRASGTKLADVARRLVDEAVGRARERHHTEIAQHQAPAPASDPAVDPPSP